MSNVSNIVKSIQDIMRKDAGTYGDAQRLEQLGWMFFLKIFDDHEKELQVLRDDYKSPLPKYLRWSTWAADEEGMTGAALLDFVDNTLLPKLENLNGSADKIAGLIRMTFQDVNNYMKNGTLLRQVVNKINGIDFNVSDDRHMFGDIYEQLLRDLQSAGNAGEFYTPRAVTQFIVDQVNPRLGERVLDPACGTGGFLTCTIEHLRKQAKTDADERKIQECFAGIEKKHLPHILCMTNMLLHGIDVPSNVRHDNTLARPLRDWSPKERVDVIVTNPPFGGMEEDGIESNFPAEFRTRETADLFLVLLMKLLKPGGRAGLVLPDGTLFGEGVKTRIKEALLTECNLHTVVRLPKGVFEPYTDIATNLLFFEKGAPTLKVWFYEHPLPARRAHLKGKSYSASDGLQPAEFEPIRKWWNNRRTNKQAWQVSIDELRKCDFDLAQNHPKHAEVTLSAPTQIIGAVRELQDECETVLRELESKLAQLQNITATDVPLDELISRRPSTVCVKDDVKYKRPRVQLHFRGARVRDEVLGNEIGSKQQTMICANDLLFSRIDAHNGAMAIVPDELHGAIATSDFPVFAIQHDRILPQYLRYCLFQPSMLRVYKHLSRGSTNRRRLNIEKFLKLKIPVPADIAVQDVVANTLREIEQGIAKMRERSGGIDEELEDLTGAALHYVFKSSKRGSAKSVIPALATEKMKSEEKPPEEFVEAIVIAQLTRSLAEPKFPLGRKRYNKLAYLAHRLAEEDVTRRYVKKAAGPYNPWSKYGGPEGIAISKRYVKRAKVGRYAGLLPGENASEIDKYVERYPVCQSVNQIVQKFHFEKNDELELIATVDFAAVDLKSAGKPITVNTVKSIIADNPEWAPKLDRDIFSDANIKRALNRLAKLFPTFYN